MLSSLAPDQIITEDISNFYEHKAEVHILRLDKISPDISGNKWFKLRFYLDEAKAMRKKGILTFGGAWSNHIVATAAACSSLGLQSIGIIRGEESPHSSVTLSRAREFGMQLEFISRAAYKDKRLPTKLQLDDYLIVNEGGYGLTGVRGASTILDYCDDSYTHFCCAAGTGTMMAGLVKGTAEKNFVTGISILKNNYELNQRMKDLTGNKSETNWRVLHDYAFGGYARHTPGLLRFMNAFYNKTAIPSDFVYTGKLFFAVSDLVVKNYFPRGSKILVVHSGGLQGNASLPAGTLMF